MSLKLVQDFLLAFIPLFVAIDPLGLTPVFLGVTRGFTESETRQVARQAMLTAAFVAVGFVLLGKLTFQILGISVADFQIAGGLILFGIAAKDLIGSGELFPVGQREHLGVVPFGMPLIAGPASITTLLLLIDSVGITITLVALLVNLTLVGIAFRSAQLLSRLIGMSRLKALSKIISLLLAAIAVHMIRVGLQGA